jgi:DNA-binding beta-propeller fold protein YncE
MPALASFVLPLLVACSTLSTALTHIAVAQDGASAEAKPQIPLELQIYPLDVAVDNQGVAYVVDRNMHGVWKWESDQLSVFFEGSAKFRTPLNAPRCIAIDPEGNVLVGDSATRDIYRVSAGKAEPITGGKIGIPMDLAVKADGTIYVADAELRTLFRIPAGSKEVEKVADVNPRGVFVDSQQQVWVVSQNEQQLQIVSDNGEAQVVVDSRVFEFPHQVVVNAAGEAFVSDGYKKAIWKVKQGSAPEIWFEGAPLDNPVGMALVDDQVVVVDPRARQVFRFDEQNKPQVWFEIAR